MKKIFSYISIFIILVQLFAPFGVDLNNKKVYLNKVDAFNYNIGITPIAGKDYVNIEAQLLDGTTSTSDYTSVRGLTTSSTVHLYATLYNKDKTKDIDTKDSSIGTKDGKITLKLKGGLDPNTQYKVYVKLIEDVTSSVSVGFGLSSSDSDKSKILFQQWYDVETTSGSEIKGQTSTTSGSIDTIDKINDEAYKNKPGDLPACGIIGEGTVLGCVAQGFYYILFKPTSFFFALAGKVLDYSFMYSISDTSYRSAFVTEGWGIVRDFCNMFFIFVLLYIAFTTILDLNKSKTKELVINVVLIGVFINFSLFATKVIIDTSNVIAKVFYNQKTISISEDGGENQLGDFGEIRLSEAIVSKINPQQLISRSGEITQIPIRGQYNENGATSGEDATQQVAYTDANIDTGNFILIIILLTVINVVGIGVFISCALIFIVRVVGLWIAMILVPFAFFSYTVPGLQSMDMVGWKKWWPETLKMAFMAPVFAFFMYIIVGFADKGLGVVTKSMQGKQGISFVLSVFVPFAFLMILLTKAKEITKSMSGNMGKQITDGISSIGKQALGAGGLVAGGAMGLGAGLLRNTVGFAGNKLANSNKLRQAEREGGVDGFIAKNLINFGKKASTSSMDIRGIKIGGKQLSQIPIGGKSLESFGFKPGRAPDTSFEKRKQEKVDKRVKRMKELELSPDSKEVKDLNIKKNNLKKLQNMTFEEMEKLDRDIKIAEDKRDAASKVDGAGSDSVKAANREVNNLKNRKKAIREGIEYEGDDNEEEVEKTRMVESKSLGPDGRPIMIEEKYKEKIITKGPKIDFSNYKIEGESIKNLEDSIRGLDNAIKKINNDAREEYAENITSNLTKFTNFITTGNTQARAEIEAANKIISNIEEAKK